LIVVTDQAKRQKAQITDVYCGRSGGQLTQIFSPAVRGILQK